jgi:O-antigen/teichoic acid export membrane protein
MQKKFITNLSLLLLLNILIKPFWILGIDRAVQNVVPAQDYGMYYAIFNFSFLFNIFLDVGITNYNNKNIAQNNHLLQKHLSIILMLRLLLGSVYLLVTLAVGWLIHYSFTQILMLAVLGFNQFLISFILYLRSNISGLHLFKTDSVISILDRLIMIVICAALLWGNITDKPFQISWYIFAQTFAYIITIIITLVIVIDKANLKKVSWNKVFSLFILKKSYPYAILVLLMTFYNRIDSVMLERMLWDGAQQAAIYASAYRLLDAGNMIAFLFAGLLLPMFAKMIKTHHRVDELVKLAFSILMLISITTAAVSFFYAHDMMKLMYHEHTQESADVFQLLMMCFVFVSTTYVFGTLLTANGNLRQLNTMAACGMLLNITLNIVLIPKYKAAGAAFASLVTQATTAIFQILIAYKFFNFKINYPFLLRFALFVVGTIALGILFNNLPIQWFVRMLMLASSIVAYALIIGFVSIRGIIHIIKQDE